MSNLCETFFVRPIHHPAARDITVEGILYALADPIRLQIFAEIQSANCPQICSQFLVVAKKELPKSTLSQHFKVLREAGLIRSESKGVEMHNTTRCDELKERFGPMIRSILDAYFAKTRRTKKRAS
jgi:DNA-binding transcriptional ArsR family regulator